MDHSSEHPPDDPAAPDGPVPGEPLPAPEPDQPDQDAFAPPPTHSVELNMTWSAPPPGRPPPQPPPPPRQPTRPPAPPPPSRPDAAAPPTPSQVPLPPAPSAETPPPARPPAAAPPERPPTGLPPPPPATPPRLAAPPPPGSPYMPPPGAPGSVPPAARPGARSYGAPPQPGARPPGGPATYSESFQGPRPGQRRTHPLPSSGPAGVAAGLPRPVRSRRWPTVLLALVSGLLGAGLALGAFLLLDDEPEPPAAAPPVPAEPPVTIIERVTEIVTPANGEGTALARAVGQLVIPSIVTVQVDTLDDDEFSADGSGSGVVLTDEGYIVTNEHVVADSSEVRVVFANGRMYDAEVLGMDARTDLAVLRIDADTLVPIKVGSTAGLEIGDPAIAVGSPLGLEGGPSLTLGVISAFDRQVQTGPNAATDVLRGMLQTDAPITRGSSGGALVDGEGSLIGITSAIGVSNVGAEGIGFAIPVEIVKRITEEIIESGLVRHAFLGITGSTDFTEESDGALVPAGVRVQSVEAGSAAEASGIEVGDLITAIDGTQLASIDALISLLYEYRVGNVVAMSVVRDGEPIELGLELGERPEGL